MKRHLASIIVLGVVLIVFGALIYLTPKRLENIPCRIGECEYGLDRWKQLYPLEYSSWLSTKELKLSGKSKYKRGGDNDLVVYDRLSEFPYLSLLYNGSGMGVEYNEPRGHYYMMTDLLDIDQSRRKAGSICLSCKTPLAPILKQDGGESYFLKSFFDAYAEIPSKLQLTGVACIDCHHNESPNLKISRWFLQKGMNELGKNCENLADHELRSATCAQCHVSYIARKDSKGRTIDLFLPWAGSKLGDISIENIINVINSDTANLEWEQSVTGFNLGFIRHPEYEFFTRGSVHYNAEVTCADCHMPHSIIDGNKVSDHGVTSPLKKDMKSCQQCHSEQSAWLKEQVLAIQDSTISAVKQAGYACVVVAKLFEMVHKIQQPDISVNSELYDKAKGLYYEAFYRLIFINAENSVGFHNPSEAKRICADAIAMAGQSEKILRQILTKNGVVIPSKIDLEIAKYVNNRGNNQLMFRREQEIKNPTETQ